MAKFEFDASNVNFTGHILPTTNDTYDIGSAEYKIRDLYVSENSLWVGDEHKISISGGKMKFRKRKTASVPVAIFNAAKAVNGNITEAEVATAALAHAEVGSLAAMKLNHWRAYMRTLANQSGATIQDIFRDNVADYAEESETNWLQSGTKCYNTVGNVGVGTTDPGALLTLHYDPEASAGLKELLRLSWNDGIYDTLKGDGSKICFNTSNVDNAPGNTEGGYLGVMKANAEEANTECDFSLGLHNGTSVVERFRILSTGQVGIGCVPSTITDYKLEVAGDINLTGDIYVDGVAQSFGAGSITVKESDGAPSISSVTTLEFDQSSGFVVTNPSSGTAKVALGSHWKTLQVSGQTSLSPTGQETLELIAGSNVTITTDDSSSPQAVTFASADTNTQLTQEQVEDYVNGVIVAGSNITKTYDDAAGTLTIAASGGSSAWSSNSDKIYYNTDNVGIGTNNPQELLHIQSNSNPTLRIQNTLSGSGSYHQDGEYGSIDFWTTDGDRALSRIICYQDGGGTGPDCGLKFRVLENSTEREAMYMFYNGNILVAPFEHGTNPAPTINLAIGDSDTGFNWVSDGNLAFYTNAAERFRLDSSGNFYEVNGGYIAGKQHYCEIELKGSTNGSSPDAYRNLNQAKDSWRKVYLTHTNSGPGTPIAKLGSYYTNNRSFNYNNGFNDSNVDVLNSWNSPDEMYQVKCTAAGIYQVNLSLKYYNNNANGEARARVRVNLAGESYCYCREWVSNGKTTWLTASDMVRMSAGDYLVVETYTSVGSAHHDFNDGRISVCMIGRT